MTTEPVNTLVVTRPQGQQSELVSALTEAGNLVQHIPMLRIEAMDAQPLTTPAPIWIFISANAVKYCLKQLSETQREQLAESPVIAIGAATAAALQAHRVERILEPEHASSEGLLALPMLKHPINNKSIVIACGEGGRDLLEQQLIVRGWSVARFECYRRLPIEAARFNSAANSLNEPNIWLISSAEVLHLLAKYRDQPTYCIVTSQRLCKLAEEYRQFTVVAVSPSANSKDLAETANDYTRQL